MSGVRKLAKFYFNKRNGTNGLQPRNLVEYARVYSSAPWLPKGKLFVEFPKHLQIAAHLVDALPQRFDRLAKLDQLALQTFEGDLWLLVLGHES